MKDRQKLTLALLCVSAGVLATLIVWTANTNTASAGASAAGGHYIMFTGSAPGASDLLYVIDRNARKMIAYEFKSAAQGNTLTPVDGIDLEKAFRD